MIPPQQWPSIGARAVVPEQVVAYVQAVSGSRPYRFGDCIAYIRDRRLVLIGYPLQDASDSEAAHTALALALNAPDIRTLTVIGPGRPPQAPAEAVLHRDDFFELTLPAPAPGPKLANLLRRAARELSLAKGREISKNHQALVRQYLDRGQWAPGTRRIFTNLGAYVAASPTSLVVSARHSDGGLAAFGVGEYASAHTAMFMFCFRDRDLAPPGSTDLVLAELIQEARTRGQTRINLGLSINDGIRFFKRKWGARKFLPCVETTWDMRPRGLLSLLRGVWSQRYR